MNELNPGQKILYYICFYTWGAFSRLPMRVLYLFSDFFTFLLYYVIRYRRRLVRKNLTDSFPDKSEKEICQIERDSYRHFCDIFMESVKYMTISKAELRRRLHLTNPEILEESYRKGRAVGIYLGHYANWEWLSSLPIHIKDDTFLTLQLYHPLENPVFNKLVNYTRERWGGYNIPVNESIRHLMKYRMEKKPTLLGFIADQTPFWNNIHYWTNFLNHPETPIFTGPERMMKKLDMDVYYMDVKRVRRGYYEVDTILMSDNPKSCEEFELTERYTRLLEKTINEAPAYWLWTHNRWKRTRQEWEKMYDAESGKVFMNKKKENV